ncbi:MAG: flagellar assembly protein FliH [Gammaproteobacteria bacterium]|nr:flagellar assembly protein FliH [Gammaproteobacteria bacterium]MBU1646190.1 flagellar assembly protein FliH [Gammaproteobacteria bacterium]MBU1972252.1 flagellar assembly protein FliH [Gammaproteobacteria bacterium]
MSNLTAWERWELAAFDGTEKPAANTAAAAAPKEQAPAPAVKLPTVEEVENIREQARQEGYKEGQTQARDEAQRLAKAAGKLDAAFKGLEDEIAEELLALAVEIARQVARAELSAQPAVLLNAIREALALLPHQHAAIFLNPEDASLARSYLGDQLTHAGHRIHEDPKLQRGDCVVESGGSHIDATVATRWRRVLDGLGLDAAWQPAETP